MDDTTPTPGQSLTLSATVRNQGTAEAAATTLRYYQSSDATITTSDTQVGTADAISALASSATSEQSSSVTAPTTTGTYYYGACVGAVTGESNTNNNCSAGVSVTVSSLLKMYWTDVRLTKIRRANLDYSNVEDLITTGDGPIGIALDLVRGKMYWIESHIDLEPSNLPKVKAKIRRANLDGSNVEDLITTGLNGPNRIALDMGRGKMYWTDHTLFGRDLGKIRRANLDGSQVEDLITTERWEPQGIALDVGRGKMYWTVNYVTGNAGTSKIQRANLDGSNVEDLITVGDSQGIALDVGRGKMYWAESLGGRGKIQRANLDGSNVENLTNGGNLTGIALDVGRGKMY